MAKHVALLLVLCVASITGEVLGVQREQQSTASGVEREEEQDRILRLPGQPEVSFKQFSGYVTVNEQVGRALFYWLTEAELEPESRPLVLWLNGAKDSLQFLLRWFDRFPRYKNRELYLTGESYAGHYVPQLAHQILQYNSRAPHGINLKGIMVGNAVTDNYYDNLGTVTYWWSHAMISDKTYKNILKSCDFHLENLTGACDRWFTYATSREFGNIDQYNIYAPPCNSSDGATTTRRTLSSPLRFKTSVIGGYRGGGYDPCTEKYAEIYYNRPDVQKALHANTTNISYKWTACNEILNRNWKDSANSILPIYKEMIAAGLRVWVFSGDVDSVVPVTATRFSLARLRLSTKIPWHPWYVKKQVAGWTEVYEGLTFATVRGAGHEVPLFKSRAAFLLFNSFLGGKPLPNS
ncbi:serine carboxypeptidase-like 25 isoform X3 [Amborella trichopoda]|uniref:serine carboxypeptidase-like 25 isoform X3 n=1 Tax=Amborella trichopoda TaxID=13333 RepID=UPI0009BEAF1B|nr:serine carboxypeptidase-like 25 isoform X3 [Amborella trichopoda]|eukprot:XP_020523838.1 serine carboxypeptidase-like 25 isoform X3 [Amborella trichopoda]